MIERESPKSINPSTALGNRHFPHRSDQLFYEPHPTHPNNFDRPGTPFRSLSPSGCDLRWHKSLQILGVTHSELDFPWFSISSHNHWIFHARLGSIFDEGCLKVYSTLGYLLLDLDGSWIMLGQLLAQSRILGSRWTPKAAAFQVLSRCHALNRWTGVETWWTHGGRTW